MESFTAFFLQEALTDALTTAGWVNVLIGFISLWEYTVVLLAMQPLLCPKMVSESHEWQAGFLTKHCTCPCWFCQPRWRAGCRPLGMQHEYKESGWKEPAWCRALPWPGKRSSCLPPPPCLDESWGWHYWVTHAMLVALSAAAPQPQGASPQHGSPAMAAGAGCPAGLWPRAVCRQLACAAMGPNTGERGAAVGRGMGPQVGQRQFQRWAPGFLVSALCSHHSVGLCVGSWDMRLLTSKGAKMFPFMSAGAYTNLKLHLLHFGLILILLCDTTKSASSSSLPESIITKPGGGNRSTHNKVSQLCITPGESAVVTLLPHHMILYC